MPPGTPSSTTTSRGSHVAAACFVRHHLNVHGHYSFQLPQLAGGMRALRDPDHDDDAEDA